MAHRWETGVNAETDAAGADANAPAPTIVDDAAKAASPAAAGSFDPARKHAPVHLGSVLVLGLGKSGAAAASYCLDALGSRVARLAIAFSDDTPANRAAAQPFLDKGACALWSEQELAQAGESFDLCIASPGISEFSPLYQAARAAAHEVVGEVEFAWRESAAGSTWVAVTGTNGKTTTTALAAHVLASCGLRAQAVGNIGDTCITAVASGDVDCYVAEVSSYQLASTSLFAPDVAVLLNITPDHLHWHRTHENYVGAKRKVLAHVGRMAVLDAVDPTVRGIVRDLKAVPEEERGFGYVPLGCAAGLDRSMIDACGSLNAAWLDGGALTVQLGGRRFDLGPAERLKIKGAHNASNALAAAAASLALGCDADRVRAALASFAPLEHRIEPCGSVAGVACYNDSKATNVDATLKALSSFPGTGLVVLLGGDDKGTDLTELAQTVKSLDAVAVCFGDAGPRFKEALDAVGAATVEAGRLEDALDAGLAHARPGDVVLLSPACASFDEFSCFEERGDVFKQLVANRRDREGA